MSVTEVPLTVDLVLAPATSMVSLPSTAVSWVGVRVKVPVPVLLFAARVIVKSATAA